METRRMCPHCRAFITTSDKVCPYCNERVGPRAVELANPGSILGGLVSTEHFATTLILLLNFGLYAATVVGSMGRGNPSAIMGIDIWTLVQFGATARTLVFQGDWWRLVTAGFLHGGILHILMNSWAMMDLGRQVEEVYGIWRFLVLYFMATVGGFLLSAVWKDVVSVGASAALFGLIGAMIAFGMKNRTVMGAAIRGIYVRWAIYGLIMGFLPGLRIDNAAHIGGLATGFAFAWVAGPQGPVRSAAERGWRVAAILCIAATVYCFLRMYLSGVR
jgi:rhomboid protease GluP